MRIQIINSNPKITDAEMREAIRFMYRLLVEDDDYKRTTIKVVSKQQKKRKQASVSPHPEKKPIYIITLNTRYSKKHQLCSLAHELVHASQFITEELGGTFEKDGVLYTKWCGEYVEEKNYYDLPWEIAAFGRQYGLYKRFEMYRKLSSDLNQEYLKEILEYNPDTGIFMWKGHRLGAPKNKPAGVIRKTDNRRKICIDGVRYYASRLAWLYMVGGWPEGEIDHINGVSSDDRWCNLREATRSENMYNRKSGRKNRKHSLPKWVFRNGNKFMAQIRRNGIPVFVGNFDTPEKAHKEAIKAAQKIHKHFLNAG